MRVCDLCSYARRIDCAADAGAGWAAMRSRNPRVADRSANHPIVFGAPYSVYVRAVRLALEEKGVPYELVPIDIFAPGGAPPEHQVRHPFTVWRRQVRS